MYWGKEEDQVDNLLILLRKAFRLNWKEWNNNMKKKSRKEQKLGLQEQ